MVLRVWHLFVLILVVMAAAMAVAFMAMGRQSTAKVGSTSDAPRPAEVVPLSDYLSRVKVQQSRFLSIEKDATAALDTLGPEPDQNWATAAVTFRQIRDSFTDIAIQLRVMRPPAELAAEHRGLTKSLELFAASADGLQQALADSDQQGVIDASARTNDQLIVELRTAWRNAVIAYARRTNASVPHWVNEIGTRG
jgi:hypothetical protein